MSNCSDSSQPALSVSRLGKKYSKSLGQTLLYGLADIGRELLFRGEPPGILRPGEFWALDNLSFEIGRGESLAIIGRNGSGKSTLLKLLYGLIKPDAGEIAINGRMAALIELGAGFDPILSGRENAYTNASILGLSRGEVDDILPAIIEFSGLHDFIDTPVKFYSSGMRARLAYSIASHLSPDVFLVDEVLAVGDFDFRQKCLRHMQGFVENGGTLLFVSHAAPHIQILCTRGLVLEEGKSLFQGSALEVLDYYYENDLHRQVGHAGQSEGSQFKPPANPSCRIQSVAIESARLGGEIRTGDEVCIVVTAEFYSEEKAFALVSILSRDLLTVVALEDSGSPVSCPKGFTSFRFRIPALPLMPGLFHIRALIREGDSRIPLATFGLENPPLRLLVSGESTATNVRARSMGQLIRLEGSWS